MNAKNSFITSLFVIQFLINSFVTDSSWSDAAPKVICANKKSGKLSLKVKCSKSETLLKNLTH
jgi:hypothetical protein